MSCGAKQCYLGVTNYGVEQRVKKREYFLRGLNIIFFKRRLKCKIKKIGRTLGGASGSKFRPPSFTSIDFCFALKVFFFFAAAGAFPSVLRLRSSCLAVARPFPNLSLSAARVSDLLAGSSNETVSSLPRLRGRQKRQ